MNYTFASFLFLLIFVYQLSAQVGVGTNMPHPSSALEIQSTKAGLLAPRMTTAQRDSISSPALGLIIYNTSTKCLNIYDNNHWQELCGISSAYSSNAVHCGRNPTMVVDITNPVTGKTWMDRNLGATEYGLSNVVQNTYGDLFQWGRRADGHQCRNSQITTVLSNSNQPAHGDFIRVDYSPFDWRNPQNNNLWQGVNGINNPCPSGYRLPTSAELENERMSWSTNNSNGAFKSPLKWSMAGYRSFEGSIFNVNSGGNYWSSTINGINAIALYINVNTSDTGVNNRAQGYSVRCIKNQ